MTVQQEDNTKTNNVPDDQTSPVWYTKLRSITTVKILVVLLFVSLVSVVGLVGWQLGVSSNTDVSAPVKEPIANKTAPATTNQITYEDQTRITNRITDHVMRSISQRSLKDTEMVLKIALADDAHTL